MSRTRKLYIGLITSGWMAALIVAGQATTTPWKFWF
jgi:hypothetical protein